MIELIELLISKRQNKKVILVGHDWGGIIAWGVAQERPRLIDRLININAPHPLALDEQLSSSWEQFARSSYMFLLNVPYIPETIIQGNDYQILDTLLGKFSKVVNETDVYKYYFSLPYGLTGPLNYYRAFLRGVGQVKTKVTFRQAIKPKTLIIWGEDDAFLLPKLAVVSAKHCLQATVKFIKNCSHFAQIEKPTDVNNLIKNYLKN